MIDELRKLNNPEINELLDKLVTLDDPSTILDKLKELESNINEKVTRVTEDFSHYIEQLKDEIQKVAGTIPDKGNAGDKGDKGDKGEQGDDGLNGRDGIDGLDGLNGEKGDKGDNGDKGEKGDKGNDGSPDTPELIRGKLETLKKDDRLDISAIRGLDDYSDLEDDVESLKKKLDKIKKDKAIIISGSAGSSGSDTSISDEFETVSKNLKSYPYALNYTGSSLTSIVYTLPGGIITKTLNYSGDTLTSIVLSGDTPSGILLTKTLTWSGDTLTAVTYL